VINAPGEECDGNDDAACAGACRQDCRCLDAVGLVEADATVKANAAAQNFGSSPELWADADTPKRSFLRVRVNGVGRRTVRRAWLELRLAPTADAVSTHGGRLRTMTDCAWNEAAVTWLSQPEVDGPVLGQAGAVQAGATVRFDVTAALAGDGVYCFALESSSADGVVYRSREVASGMPVVVLDVTAPPATSTTTTTAIPSPTTSTTAVIPPPRCGDGTVNLPGEACDGADDATCPGACSGDCLCRLPVGVVAADATVTESEPRLNLGQSAELWADADTPKRTFLRVYVTGVGRRAVTRASLRLQVAQTSKAASDSGGRLRAITDCTFAEETVTWQRQPALDGPVIDEAGSVAHGDVVAFDVAAAVRGDGVYCFALESRSADAVIYHSREVAGAGPAVVVEAIASVATSTSTTTSLPTSGTSSSTTVMSAPPTTSTLAARCGDGIVNSPVEACDGADDVSCPGACVQDCRCAIPAGLVEADATVMAREPGVSFGSSPELWADADTAKRTFLRVRVTGVGRRAIGSARLWLRVGETRDAPSESGGRLRRMSDCAWLEQAVTWERQPAADGAVLDEVGPVAAGAEVAFDVTQAVAGDGTYCFALESVSADGVMYRSREAGVSPPRLALILAILAGD
jgi:hypothetical protein